MALSKGQRWGIFTLMATHGNTVDGKSALRTAVETSAKGGATLHDALVSAVQTQVDHTVQNADIGPLPSLSSSDLRTALAFDTTDYDQSMGPCPDPAMQTKVFNALKTIA